MAMKAKATLERAAASSTGTTRCGATPIRRGRASRAASTCSPPGTWPSRKTPAPPHNIPQPAGGGDRNAMPLYDFPHQHVVNHLIKEMPLRVSALRTLGAYANVFALESFMDELALAAGADPVAFRLRPSEGSARPRGDRGGRQESRLEAGPEGRRRPRPRHRLRQVQEPRHLRGGDRRRRGRPRDRHGAGAARLCGGRLRADHQSGRPRPTRSRAASSSRRAGRSRKQVRFDPERHRVARLAELSDPDHAGGAARSRSS